VELDDPEEGGSVPPNARLLEWAEAIADGRAVDWGRARREGLEPEGSIAALELVESLIQAHLEAKRRLSSDPSPLPVECWGDLRLLEKIGEGAFGEVYRAFDPALQIEVALKLMRWDEGEARAPKRFEEARRLARVRHPHVVRVYGVAHREGRVGIWMELVRGKTLEEILTSEGPFGAREAASGPISAARSRPSMVLD